MATKRKKKKPSRAVRVTTSLSSNRKTPTRKRRKKRGLSAGLTGNIYMDVALGFAATIAVKKIIDKMDSEAKEPMFKDEETKNLVAAAAPALLGHFMLKNPSFTAGAIAGGIPMLAKKAGFLDEATMTYVPKNLLMENPIGLYEQTLSDNNGNMYGLYEGNWYRV